VSKPEESPASVVYRDCTAMDLPAAAALVQRSFQDAVAPLYPPEGVATVLAVASPEKMHARLGAGHFALVAERAGRLVGYAEVRDGSHLLLLFVDSKEQGRGIGRRLFTWAIRRIREKHPEVMEVTVNASPNAVSFYRAAGCTAEGKEIVDKGVRFQPMVLRIR